MAAKNEVRRISAEGQSLMGMVQALGPQIKKALPAAITPERFTRIAISAIQNNEKLQKCDKFSFLSAMMSAAQLGLEPNTPLGQAYLIPYWNTKKGTYECQFQVGYKGMLDLAYRNPEVQTITAQTVYENDVFEYELGLTDKLVHKPAMTNRGEPVAYYAIYKLKNGGYGFRVMSREDIEAHKNQYSQADRGGTSPWKTDFDSMAKKTVIKQLLKYAPIKSDLQYAVGVDETVPVADEVIDKVVAEAKAEELPAEPDLPAEPVQRVTEQPKAEEQPKQQELQDFDIFDNR